MADEGLITVIITLTKEKRIIGEPIINSCGFTDNESDSSKELNKTISQIALDTINKLLNTHKNLSTKTFEKQITGELTQFLFQKIDRRPLIAVKLNIIDKV